MNWIGTCLCIVCVGLIFAIHLGVGLLSWGIMTDTIVQILIFIFSASAVFFVGSKRNELKRIGFICGILGQPLWFYTTFMNEQWGIFLLSFWYTFAWSRGLWNHRH